MNALEKKKDGQAICFLFYTPKVCFAKRKVLYIGEEIRLTVTAEQLEEDDSIDLRVAKQEKGYLINGKEVRDDGYIFLSLSKQQKVLVVLTEENTTINACGKLMLDGKNEIAIGTRFQNAVFLPGTVPRWLLQIHK